MRFRHRSILLKTFCGILLTGAVAPAGERTADLAAPVRIEADGKPIDHGDSHGHASPCVFDVDGDGVRDLVVGEFGDTFTFYRNVGTNAEPRYEAAGKLMAGDEPAKVNIYCCIASSPQFADLNGDGHADLISGSYDPGACYWFPGNGDGTFQGREGTIAKKLAQKRPPVEDDDKVKNGDEKRDPHWAANGLPIRDRTGQVILRFPDQEERFYSFGCWPFPIDWDADGDLDLLIGGFGGAIRLRENLGTKMEFAFAETPVEVEAAGKPILLKASNGAFYGHAAVVAADWNRDGLFDLVSGCNDGAVRWFENIGKEGTPRFAAAKMLVGPAGDDGYNRFLNGNEAPAPGIRSQVAVADMNGDERMDLLVGDFSTTLAPRADLTKEESATLKKRLEAYLAADQALDAQDVRIQHEADKLFEGIPVDERPPKILQDKWWDRLEELRDEPEFRAAADAQYTSWKKLRPFLKEIPEGSDNLTVSHGYVWLYLREPSGLGTASR